MIKNRKIEKHQLIKKNNKFFYTEQMFYAGVIAFAMMIIVYLIRGLYPFGDKTLLYSDLYQQRMPLLYNFYDTLIGKTNFFANFNVYTVANNYNLILPKLINPVNYIVFLYPRNNIYLSINTMMICYAILAAITSNYMLNKLFPNCKWNIHLSLCYALSGFVCDNYLIPDWLWVVVIFPLFILSLKNMKDKNSGTVYCILLAFILMQSIQIGFMTLLFVVLFSFIFLCYEDNRDKRKMIIFTLGIYTLIAVLLSGIALLPNLLDIITSSRVSAISTTGLFEKQYFSDVLDRIFMIFNPFLAVVIFKFLKNKKESFKSKINNPVALILIVLTITALFTPFNIIWHMGSYACFPLRYGFIINLLSSIYCAYLIENKKITWSSKTSNNTKAALLIVSVGLIYLIYFFTTNFTDAINCDLCDIHKEYINVVGIVLITILIAMFVFLTAFVIKITKKKVRRVLVFAVLSTFLMEMFAFSMHPEKTMNDYMQEINNVQTTVMNNTNYKEYSKIKNIESTLNMNYGLVTNIKTMGGMLGVSDAKYKTTLTGLGYSIPFVHIGTGGGTILSDSILGFDYVSALTQNNNVCKHLYQKLYNGAVDGKEYDIYYNQYVMNGVITKKGNFNNETINKPSETFANQNALYKSITSSNKELFTIQDQGSEKKTATAFSVSVPANSILYLSGPFSNDTAKILIDGSELKLQKSDFSNNVVIEIGFFKVKQDVKIEISSDDEKFALKDIKTAYTNIDDFKNFVKEYNANCNITDENNALKISVSSKETDNVIILPINNINGMSYKLNGKTVQNINNSYNLVMLNLEKGLNNIEIVYTPSGLYLSIVITILGIFLLILFSFITHSLLNKTFILKIAEFAYCLVIVAFFLIVYEIPLLSCILENAIKIFK